MGNAKIEAKTLEKFYTIAGTEFYDREGHIIIVSKSLYVIFSSGII